MISVNTNTDAMIALEYLNRTQGSLAQTENAVSTGLTVANAKDNGAIYAIAQNMRGDVAGYHAVTQSLENGTSTIDVALAAGQSISDLLIQMKQQSLASSDTSMNTSSRQALNDNFQALLQQITTVVQNAQFNGANLINGTTNKIEVLASSDGQHRITVLAQNMSLSGPLVTIQNMSLSGPLVTISAAGSISTQAQASAMITSVETSLTNVDAALANLGSGSAKFSIQATFVQNLSDTLTTGIGNLVDANMAQESAMLTALQTKQQLGVQALSIANQSPQIALSLFR
jgi:flagellin